MQNDFRIVMQNDFIMLCKIKPIFVIIQIYAYHP